MTKDVGIPPPGAPSSEADAPSGQRIAAQEIVVEPAGFAAADLYQRREKIFTRNVSGRFQRLRLYTGWPLLLGYFLTPWLQWGDRQAVLFDLPTRQFHVFGVTFWPQDLMLLAWLLIIAAFSLFLFTTLVGRLWCGYTCPQTVWTSIFMWVEQITEGTRNQRIRLDRDPWSFTKLRKRGAKHILWLCCALCTGLAFVGYFAPIRELVPGLIGFSLSGWALFWILFFALATYINAGWMREQVCIHLCPYARFQSVMFDRDTLTVCYDRGRGEPRGSRKIGADPQAAGLGDCINCQMCVQVCPTGIDIRNGLQYQCIGCAHCIDACDQVMDKMGYQRGLIRYATERSLEGGAIRMLRPKSIGYALALLVMAGLFTITLLGRTPLELDVLRDRNQLYTQAPGGQIRNSYTLKILNMDQVEHSCVVSISGLRGASFAPNKPVQIAPGEVFNMPITVDVNPDVLTTEVQEIRFSICTPGNNQLCVSEVSRFLGPPPLLPKN